MKAKKFTRPILIGILLSFIIHLIKLVDSQENITYLFVLYGLSFFATGIVNYQKDLDFKQKMIRLIVQILAFFIIGLIFESTYLNLKLCLILLVIGLLMNIFLIMKKGHWIAIIVLGFLTMFFIINSYITKKYSESQTERLNEVIELNQDLKEELELAKQLLELNKQYNNHLIDSLKGELQKK